MTSAAQAAAAADTRQTAPYQWLKHYPQKIDWHQKLTPAPLFELLDSAAAKYGSRPCTNFLGKVLTYREIARAVDRAAAGLQKLGVTKGTKVGLFMPNCPTFIIYYFATLKAGGTVVNYNPLYTLEELAFQVKDSETELMVTLDLKLLFDKVEGLMKSGRAEALDRGLLPGPAAGRQVRAVQALQGQGAGAPDEVRRWRPTSCSTPMS